MYPHHIFDEKSLYFVDFLINTIKILEVTTVTCEWGKRRNVFKLYLYALKFDLDRLFACLNDMGGFMDSNLTHTPTFFHHQYIMYHKP